MSLTNYFEILKYCKTFYFNLYSKTQTNSELQQELSQPLNPKITHEANEKPIQQISLSKLKTAIFQMENGKSLGIDGLPTEFYKSF